MGMREEELAQMFWEVSRCWNDHTKAVTEEMTTERAIQSLVQIRDGASSKALRNKAAKLLHDVIYRQSEPQVEAELEDYTPLVLTVIEGGL